MKRMFEVSIATCSARGFFLPPRSGTFTTVPSSILSNACHVGPRGGPRAGERTYLVELGDGGLETGDVTVALLPYKAMVSLVG